MSVKYLNNNRNIIFYAVLAIIFFLGLYLRLYAINHTYVDIPLRADAKDYYAYAYNITNHNVYSRSTHSIRKGAKKPEPDAIRSPGYPIFISIFANDFPDIQRLLNITLLQGLISLITLLLAYKIVIQILPRPLALISALLTAISPHLINSNIYILTESLFTFLLIFGIWLSVFFLKTPEKRRFALLVGVVIGLGALTRPSLQYFIIPLILFFIFKHKELSFQQKKNILLFTMLGFSIIIAPWHIRNYISTGEFSNDTLKINALHHGMYPDFMFQGRTKTYGFPYRYDPRSNEISKSVKSVSNEIIHRFKTEPGRHLKWYIIDKPVTFLSWNMIQGMGDSFIYPINYSPYFNKNLFIYTNQVMKLLHYPLILLAVIASILIWVPRLCRSLTATTVTSTRLLSLVLFYFIIIHIIVAPFPRYNIPLRPIIHIMAFIPLLMLYNLGRKKNDQPYTINKRS